MNDGRAVVRRLLAAGREKRSRLVAALEPEEAEALDWAWPAWVHQGQEAPEGEAWRVWVMLAGRGFGKTRAGAEWVSELARANPGAAFALVAGTAEEARAVMVEGRSGLIAVARPEEREKMIWEPSRRRLVFANGAEAFVYSGANANALRGPEHHFAWCDELAKWRQAEEAWSNLMLGLRLGTRPRALVTTTPRSIALLKELIGDEATVRSGGASAANPHVAAAFVSDMERRIGGTRLGRQELEGVLVDEVEGALWTRSLIEASRLPHPNPSPEGEGLRKVVVGVDPPASNEGVCGIVVCGVDAQGTAYVLADLSAGGLSPEGWARKVAAAADAWGARRVVAEANNGGTMVEAVLRGAGLRLPVRLVHAADGKSARAAPVATLFEGKRAKFAGRFPALEDELAGLSWDPSTCSGRGGGYSGPGRSPDRADAMVWAMTELMLKRPSAEPRIVRF
jgi:phage terminase large subunit-like protein